VSIGFPILLFMRLEHDDHDFVSCKTHAMEGRNCSSEQELTRNRFYEWMNPSLGYDWFAKPPVIHVYHAPFTCAVMNMLKRIIRDSFVNIYDGNGLLV